MNQSTHTCRRLSRRLAPAALGAALAAAGGLLTGCDPISDAKIEFVQMTDVAKAIKDNPKSYLVLDARDAASYEAGHLPTAKRMTAADIDEHDPDPRLKSYKAIYTYGEHPNHNNAKALTKRLMITKVNDIYLMDEGYIGWKAKGYPVVTGNELGTWAGGK